MGQDEFRVPLSKCLKIEVKYLTEAQRLCSSCGTLSQREIMTSGLAASVLHSYERVWKDDIKMIGEERQITWRHYDTGVNSMYWTTQKEAFNICSYYDSNLSVSSNKSGPCPYIPCVSFASTKADGQIARPSLLICFAFDDKEGHRRIIPDNKSNPASFLPSFLPLESYCVQ